MLCPQQCLTVRDPMHCSLRVPLSMGFFRQEFWNGWPFPSPGDLPDLEIEPVSLVSPALQADSLPAEPLRKPEMIFQNDFLKSLKSRGDLRGRN